MFFCRSNFEQTTQHIDVSLLVDFHLHHSQELILSVPGALMGFPHAFFGPTPLVSLAADLPLSAIGKKNLQWMKFSNHVWFIGQLHSLSIRLDHLVVSSQKHQGFGCGGHSLPCCGPEASDDDQRVGGWNVLRRLSGMDQLYQDHQAAWWEVDGFWWRVHGHLNLNHLLVSLVGPGKFGQQAGAEVQTVERNLDVERNWHLGILSLKLTALHSMPTTIVICDSSICCWHCISVKTTFPSPGWWFSWCQAYVPGLQRWNSHEFIPWPQLLSHKWWLGML